MTDFQKVITFRPAFDKRNPEPHKNYGIGAMEIFFVLKGPAALYHLPHPPDGISHTYKKNSKPNALSMARN